MNKIIYISKSKDYFTFYLTIGACLYSAYVLYSSLSLLINFVFWGVILIWMYLSFLELSRYVIFYEEGVAVHYPFDIFRKNNFISIDKIKNIKITSMRPIRGLGPLIKIYYLKGEKVDEIKMRRADKLIDELEDYLKKNNIDYELTNYCFWIVLIVLQCSAIGSVSI